jgi:glycosyltransferase involved in cell wall biosynthesis
MRAVDLVVPGDLATATGGYVYDRRMLEGLAQRGWRTAVHSLDTSFPRPTRAAARAARQAFAAIPDGRVVLIDGLALAGLEQVLVDAAERLALVALIHHPLALETGLDDDTRRLLEQTERSALALVRRVIVTSQWTARALSAYHVPIERVRIVEPGTDAPAHEHAPRADVGTLSLLCVATVTLRKGHAVLVDALADLRDRRWHLSCVGSLTRDPQAVEDLNRRITRLRLTNRVSLLGDLDGATLERYYERADVFVLASYLEGYGMALAEAVARGLPIVSTTGGAIAETVPEHAGLLVRPGDSRALAKALGEVMDDPDKRAALARGASAARRRLPSWSDAAAKLEAALERLESER